MLFVLVVATTPTAAHSRVSLIAIDVDFRDKVRNGHFANLHFGTGTPFPFKGVCIALLCPVAASAVGVAASDASTLASAAWRPVRVGVRGVSLRFLQVPVLEELLEKSVQTGRVGRRVRCSISGAATAAGGGRGTVVKALSGWDSQRIWAERGGELRLPLQAKAVEEGAELVWSVRLVDW